MQDIVDIANDSISILNILLKRKVTRSNKLKDDSLDIRYRDFLEKSLERNDKYIDCFLDVVNECIFYLNSEKEE